MHPDPSSGRVAGEELTHLGILPPSGSWWWYCSTITVTTTERPTMIMVLAKYWAAESTDAGVLPQHSTGNPDGGIWPPGAGEWGPRAERDLFQACSPQPGEASPQHTDLPPPVLVSSLTSWLNFWEPWLLLLVKVKCTSQDGDKVVW